MLAVAPTGTGKTLAAFLWALDALLSGRWSGGAVRALYVSPLRALNNDIRANLLGPLREIRGRLAAEAGEVAEVEVLVRSGDTPQAARRRMVRRPPQILITTPESLNLLLGSPRARHILCSLKTVILDEVHAVAGAKRGTHLFSAVERLVALSGEFQRLALSATVRPPERVAALVGGYVLERRGGRAFYAARKVEVVEARGAKRLEVSVRPILGGGSPGEGFWEALAGELRRLIRAGRSTLLFTNARRTAEKLARLINEGQPEPLAYAHHGSLSREIRLVVERRLREGRLRAIVATSSLELGIDIGSLDRVLLVQCPFSAASALQRIGRAGHGVGKVSRGEIFPSHGWDLLEAAVMARAVLDQEIEEIRPVLCPLDVLAQVVVSMTAVDSWQVEALHQALRCAAPFHELSRSSFERVLEMLAGRYGEGRVRELRPRISWDRLEGSVRAVRGALPLVYRSGGTIPDRGAFALRLAGTGARLGELDEEFVWERKVGDTFSLGTQSWRIERIGERDVEVSPWEGPVGTMPFWRAERGGREYGFCARIGELLERWQNRLRDASFRRLLVEELWMEPPAAEQLVEYLERQRTDTGAELPHRHHLLVEQLPSPGRAAEPTGLARVVVHALWGARVNRAFALVLEAAWEERFGERPEVFADNAGLLIVARAVPPAAELLGLADPARMEDRLRRTLGGSALFGAHFRENAGRALLLPRSGPGTRVPLWLTRQRARRLLEAVRGYEDFPIVLESWRGCLHEELDLPSLKELLEEVACGSIRWTEVESPRPSAFARTLVWQQTGSHVYAGDAPGARAQAGLPGDLFQELLASGEGRLLPRLEVELVGELEERLQRTASGYAPGEPREVLDLVRERVLVSGEEWERLLQAVERDGPLNREELLAALTGALVRLRFPGATRWVVAAREALPRILRAFGAEPAGEEAEGEGPAEMALRLRRPASSGPAGAPAAEAIPQRASAGAGAVVEEWLRFYGPVPPAFAASVFGLEEAELLGLLRESLRARRVVQDRLLAGSEEAQLCDAGSLEILLRRLRRRRAAVRARPREQLSLFLASVQGLCAPRREPEALREALSRLFGCPLPVELWEGELLPARLLAYRTAWLDRLFQESDLLWFGCGRRRVSLCLAPDLELFPVRTRQGEGAAALLPSLRGRFDLWELKEHTGLHAGELAQRLWEQVWRGGLSAEGFQALRRAAQNDFEPPRPVRPRRRWGTERWRGAGAAGGRWFALQGGSGGGDPLEAEELNRDRVRQLLDRYGVLFRELLQRELPALRWGVLFRTLRRMELAGEVSGGFFFEGLPGLQFIASRLLGSLERLPEECLYWVCAADPASVCGLGLEDRTLPPRLASSHLVYRGSRLVLVSRRRGARLEFLVPPEDQNVVPALSVFREHLERDFDPWNHVLVQTVNGLAARSSPYREALLAYGFREEYRGLVLRARP